MAYNGLAPYYGNGPTRRRRAPTPPATTNALDKALALAKTARGGADLLYEALVNAEGPRDLRGGIVQEFRTDCRRSLRVIEEQISWLSGEIHNASVSRSGESPLVLARASEELVAVQSELAAVLRLYDGLERAGADRVAQERVKNDHTIHLLTSGSGLASTTRGESSRTPSRAPSPSNEERWRRVSNIAKTARGHADLLRDTLMFSSAADLSGSLIEEFHKNCIDSQRDILKHLQWADAEAAKSRRRASSSSTTHEETLFNDLIATDQTLTDALKTYDNMRREETAAGKRRQAAADPFADPGAELEAGFAAARAGKGNAELLLDALRHARREDLSGELIQEFRSSCRASQTDIIAQIPPASAAAEQSQNVASGSGSTREENMLEELLGANEVLLKALELYDAIESGTMSSQDTLLGGRDQDLFSKQLPATPTDVMSALEQQTLHMLPPLTTQDKAKFTKIFYANNPNNGVLTGAQARNLLLKSKLPQDTLSRICAQGTTFRDLADISRRGVLDLGDFTIAMYLVKGCMSGSLQPLPSSLPAALYEQAGSKPLPTLPSQDTAPSASRFNPPGPSATPMPAASNATGYFDGRSSAKTHAERIFETLDPERAGRAQGYMVTSFMLKVGLTMETSSQIMDVVDTGKKGYLTQQEFAQAMQLVDRKKAGEDIAATVPPSSSTQSALAGPSTSGASTLSLPSLQTRPVSSLIDMDAPLDPTLVPLPRTPISPSLPSPGAPFSPPNRSQAPSTQPLQSQATAGGSAFAITPTPSPRSSPPRGHQRSVSQQWDVNPVAKARFDTFFDNLDPWRKGYIEGDVAVPFFAKSKLPDGDMADIWDLADANHDGRLTRDEFAVVMHLIRERLKGREVPRTLPPSLVPPSLRQPPPLPPRGASLRTTETPPRPMTGSTPQPILAQSTGTPSIAPPAFSERAETPPPSYDEVVRSGLR
ncbi:uncharacterized protein B0H18DRAFT_1104723 [Fomitopsis serialis]|uniref:uncharacterized protein n=1 Tax=Fomitopsis serialis TaxID=139415 RepID=UPI0020083487|nr:uncharacterized protein B0H18DRAFT_1104723 [Neoantrodia serialis]KAH9925266.1 hypothetical protein B0H18DRAFT_1104723 [Neoantrodia serialis]